MRTRRFKFGVFFAAVLLFADGGTLVFRKPAGPFIVTAFSSPAPVRVGAADLSVMLQKAADRSTVLDARVAVHLLKSDGGKIVEIVVPATRAQSANKLLYAARATLPSAGQWRLDVLATALNESVTASGVLAVLPLQPPLMKYWPWIAIAPLALLLFLMNQWLKARRRLKRLRAQP